MIQTKCIVLEGNECTGKSTAAKVLVESLREQGYSVLHYCEPDKNSPLRESIRELAIQNEMSDLTRALLMFANRNDMFEEINSLLIADHYDYLVLERSYVSTLVYQGRDRFKMLFDELVRQTTLYPANTYFYLLTADAKTARSRRSEEVFDVIEKDVMGSDIAYDAITNKYRNARIYRREYHTELLSVEEIVDHIIDDVGEPNAAATSNIVEE